MSAGAFFSWWFLQSNLQQVKLKRIKKMRVEKPDFINDLIAQETKVRTMPCGERQVIFC